MTASLPPGWREAVCFQKCPSSVLLRWQGRSPTALAHAAGAQHHQLVLAGERGGAAAAARGARSGLHCLPGDSGRAAPGKAPTDRGGGRSVCPGPGHLPAGFRGDASGGPGTSGETRPPPPCPAGNRTRTLLRPRRRRHEPSRGWKRETPHRGWPPRVTAPRRCPAPTVPRGLGPPFPRDRRSQDTTPPQGEARTDTKALTSSAWDPCGGGRRGRSANVEVRAGG